jgi:hypothetical protein
MGERVPAETGGFRATWVSGNRCGFDEAGGHRSSVTAQDHRAPEYRVYSNPEDRLSAVGTRPETGNREDD